MKETDNSNLSLQNVSQVVAALVACGFVISLIYDWGFLRAIGLGYSEVPISVSDLFRTGIIWLPPLLIGYIIYIAWEFQIQRVERGLTEEEIVQGSPNPERTRRFRNGPRKFFVFVSAFFGLGYILMGDIFAPAAPVSFLVLWIVFAEWCYSSPLIQLRRNRVIQLSFVILPAVAIFSYYSGYDSGLASAHNKNEEITIKSAGHADINGYYLIGIQDGLLYLSKDNKASFMRWDSISSYTFKNPYHFSEGVLCSWLDLCLQQTKMSVNESEKNAKHPSTQQKPSAKEEDTKHELRK